MVLAMSLALAAVARTEPDSLTVGFVTCEPGPEIFELYGHEGVRVSGRLDGRDIDVVFNYGLFDFGAPGFVWRFVKGETDYMAGVQSTDMFLYGYRMRGSRVTERVLPLSADEARQLFGRLYADTQPGRETYRYKYFTNNCATKPLAHLEAVTGGRLVPASEGDAPTYRDLLRKYNEGYPWYQFGIDLVLGFGLDKPVEPRQASFIPVELDRIYFSDMPRRELYEGEGDRRLEATPFFLSPLFVSLLLLAGACLMVVSGWRARAVVALWFLLQGLAGLLVCYLAFFSDHEGTSPNLLAFWLNPLWLLILPLLWMPRCRRLCDLMLMAAAVVAALSLVLWPLLPQSTAVAVFPLMAVTVLVSISGLSPGRIRALLGVCRHRRP